MANRIEDIAKEEVESLDGQIRELTIRRDTLKSLLSRSGTNGKAELKIPTMPTIHRRRGSREHPSFTVAAKQVLSASGPMALRDIARASIEAGLTESNDVKDVAKSMASALNKASENPERTGLAKISHGIYGIAKTEVTK